jgi:2-keto-3-deoxy-L-rhamnonate aldolase RhmA
LESDFYKEQNMSNAREMPFNPVKKKLQAGQKTAGAWLGLASPITAEILSLAGFDWLVLDMEHGAGDDMTMLNQFQAMNGSGVVPLVRVAGNDPLAIKRTLDAGALGVVVPDIQTKEEAEAAYRAVKYHPLGTRGISGNTRAGSYGIKNNAQLMETANERTMLIVQIESPQAVANLDEILQVEGINVFFIGPRDLGTSMGYFNNAAHPEVKKVIATIEEKVFGAGKVLGTVTGSWEQAQEKYAKGYQFLSLMSEATALGKLGTDLVNKFKENFPQE